MISSRTGDVLVNRHSHDRLGPLGRAVIDTARKLKAKQPHGDDVVPDAMLAPAAMARPRYRTPIRP